MAATKLLSTGLKAPNHPFPSDLRAIAPSYASGSTYIPMWRIHPADSPAKTSVIPESREIEKPEDPIEHLFLLRLREFAISIEFRHVQNRSIDEEHDVDHLLLIEY